MPKKILAISHYYAIHNRGGGEVMLHRILRHFVKLGYEVDAVATNTEDVTQELDGVTVYHGERHKKMLTKKYDLVFTQFENSAWVIDESKKLKIPTVMLVHNDIQKTQDTVREHPPSLVVFNTNWIKERFYYKGRSIVVHPPVYASEHATERGNEITLINLLVSKGANTFYNVAQFTQNEYFLGVKGGYFKDQQVILHRRNVSIIENTDNMKEDVWSRTKILLMPSSYETYGMAGVEAMASGIPVIANPTPGLVESLSYAGIFPKQRTIAAWKYEIARLRNPVYYKRMSDLALQRSAELDPEIELAELVKEVERL